MKGIKLLFKNNTRERLAHVEGDSAIQTARIQELDRQISDLQVMVEALAVVNQQMVHDMKVIYDSLSAIVGDNESSGLDKYFVSIINNSGGGKLPH